jgi:hypothetical protein
MRFDINDSAVRRRRTRVSARAVRNFAEYERTAVFDSVAAGRFAPINHFAVILTYGNAVFVNTKMRGIFEIPLIAESDNRVDIPKVKQLISGNIVASGVVNKSVDFQVGVKVAKFGKSNNSGNAVMPPRLDEAQIQR